MVRIWYERLLNADQSRFEMAGEWLNCKSNCMSYLSHLVHYLDVRQRSIEERLANQQLPLDEFQGIDLNTARQLYVTYSKELNVLESNSAQQQFLISQINHPDFEISSLSAVMNDPISIEMISKASKQIISLRDYENRTQKEQERIKASLAIYKEFFITHIGQELQLIDLRQQILKEKIKALQSTNLALIQERISILENQMAEYLAKRLTSLKRERVLYEDILEEFRKEMALLPHKWVNEKLINQQMEINQSMVEEISRLVESKNITNNLETIQSTPIDLPLLPLHPRPPHLLLFSLVGAAAGAFLGFAWVLGKSIAGGVEAAEDNLRLAGQYVAGRLSKDFSCRPGLPLLDSELDTLRRLIAFMEMGGRQAMNASCSCEGQTLLLLIGKGPNYAPALADLISKMGLKTIIINACFDQKDSHQTESGMLQYLEGKTEQPAIINHQSYDIIPAGGITRHATELMAARRFSALLESLQTRYDWIIVCSNASVISAEAESLVDRFSNVAVSLDGEPLDKLGAYIQAAPQYCDSQRHIAYIFLDQQR
jgi:tyrosine-protein kinase Etk/Wzc